MKPSKASPKMKDAKLKREPMIRIRPHTEADGLDLPQREVLKAIGNLPKGQGMTRPENKWWNRVCDQLIARGFVYDFDGAVAITDAGRSQLRANS